MKWDKTPRMNFQELFTEDYKKEHQFNTDALYTYTIFTVSFFKVVNVSFGHQPQFPHIVFHIFFQA